MTFDSLDPHARPPVVLAVPGYLRVDDQEGQLLTQFDFLWPDADQRKNRHRTWAAENSKRYLAGSVVVGTINQVLLSTLVVGHAHLRATSLSRLYLVVDEVHASDTYMTTLLDRVLAFHLALGGHALLMSATLGTAAQARFFARVRPSKCAAVSGVCAGIPTPDWQRKISRPDRLLGREAPVARRPQPVGPYRAPADGLPTSWPAPYRVR